MIFVQISLLSSLCSLLTVIHSYEIETKLGKIRGVALPARNNKTYHAYYGIPYAEAPVGELRFEPPTPASSWNGTLNATTIRLPCPQISEYSTNYEGVEDCLYVDLYTPENAAAGSNFPVVFYVFGGLYKYGTTVREGVSFFMARDIIIVRVSYRLGVLGYLSTGDTVIPGNMGMKDQAMALRWTKENIYEFGGDPNRITIHGHSSGAGCAHLLTLSPLSRDNYNRAVFQSGFGTSPHLFSDRATAKAMTHVLAENVNCPTWSHEHLKNCLQNKTVEELVIAANKSFIWKTEPQTIFRPTIEDKNVEGAFLVSHPLLTPYVSHDKAWIIGMTSAESLAYINAFNGTMPLLGDKVTFPIAGTYQWTAKLGYVNYIERLARTHFFGNGPSNNRTGLVKMFNGIMHGMTLLDAVQTYKGPKFIYWFDYKGLNEDPNDDILGVGHANDLQLIFSRPNEKNLTQEDVIFGEEIITRFVNFYYSGDPNQPFAINKSIFAEWEPMSSPRVEYLCINRTGYMGKDLFVNEYSWWKNVPFFSKDILDH